MVPWVVPGDRAWQTRTPLFQLAGENVPATAAGWIAVTNQDILFHVVVKKEKHENDQGGNNIWNGDAIQLGVEALGDGPDEIPVPLDVDKELERKFGAKTKAAYVTRELKDLNAKWQNRGRMPRAELIALDTLIYKTRGDRYNDWDKEKQRLERFNKSIDDGMLMMPADADLVVGLGHGGVAQAWTYYHGRVGATGDKSYLKPAIVRDEKTKTTTYDFAIPWKEFGVQAGISPVMKVSIQINCGSAPAGKPQRRLYWGKGVGGRFVPWHFKKLALGLPPAAVAAIHVERDEVTSVEDHAEIRFALTMDQARAIAADFEGKQKTLDLAGQPGTLTLKRYAVRAYPGKLPMGSLSLKAALLSRGDGKA